MYPNVPTDDLYQKITQKLKSKLFFSLHYIRTNAVLSMQLFFAPMEEFKSSFVVSTCGQDSSVGRALD